MHVMNEWAKILQTISRTSHEVCQSKQAQRSPFILLCSKLLSAIPHFAVIKSSTYIITINYWYLFYPFLPSNSPNWYKIFVCFLHQNLLVLLPFLDEEIYGKLHTFKHTQKVLILFMSIQSASIVTRLELGAFFIRFHFKLCSVEMLTKRKQ